MMSKLPTQLFMCAPRNKEDEKACNLFKRKSNDCSYTSSDEGSFEETESSDNSKYKTELCRSFDETGQCKYGHKCQFAHGPEELRSLHRHPRYKTQLCRRFHEAGFCSYGTRCHFLHDSHEQHLVYAKGRNGNKSENTPESQEHTPKSLMASLDGHLKKSEIDLLIQRLCQANCLLPFLAESSLLCKSDSGKRPTQDDIPLNLIHQQLPISQAFSDIHSFLQQQQVSNSINVFDGLCFL